MFAGAQVDHTESFLVASGLSPRPPKRYPEVCLASASTIPVHSIYQHSRM